LFSGVDVTANQDEISDHERFQLEFDNSTKRWYIRTMQDRYWTLETGGGIQAVGDKRYVHKNLGLYSKFFTRLKIKIKMSLTSFSYEIYFLSSLILNKKRMLLRF
jgi:hypothetical protein